jgi:hypothetical protein
VGRTKARFFASLGFDRADWSALRRALLALAASGEAEAGERTRFGQKYIVRGTIRGPAGRTGRVLSAWIVLAGEDFPRLVTAYPGDAT